MKDTLADRSKATILWVEDEQDLREVLAEELQDAGYSVVQALNGQDALNQLRHCRPDLILCDIAMPVMDGYQLLRVIRETMADLSDVPFVFLSAQDASGQITQGKYAGADDYLVKPINFDLMLATIAARLRQITRLRDKLASDMRSGADTTGILSSPEIHVFQRLTRMFNMITSGVVLLDREGRILFANVSAQRLLLYCADSVAVEISSAGGLQSFLATSSVIRTAIEAALNGDEHIEFISLPRRNGERDLLVTICALDCLSSADTDPVVALFIGAGGPDEPAPVKALESLFKLTPTEGRIAWAFAQGLRPEQIAESFDISLTTVAFHKRNIFQKTYTNRQADLIALLLTLPASVDVS